MRNEGGHERQPNREPTFTRQRKVSQPLEPDTVGLEDQPKPYVAQVTVYLRGSGAPSSDRRVIEIPRYSDDVISNAKLSPQETDVYELRCKGLTRKQVAARLDVPAQNTTSALHRALRKLHSAELMPIEPRDSDTKKEKAKPEITSRQKEILTMIAQGYAYEEIGKRLHVARETVYKHIALLPHTSANSSQTNVIFSIINELVADKSMAQMVLRDIDVSKFDTVSLRQKKILNALIKKRGQKSTFPGLQETTGLSRNILDKDIRKMNTLLGTKNKMHLTAVYAATNVEKLRKYKSPEKIKPLTKRQKEIVTYVAQGEPVKKIFKQLGINRRTLMTHIEMIKKNYSATSYIEIGLKALKAGELDPLVVLQQVDHTALDTLTPREIKPLHVLVSNDGRNSSRDDMSRILKRQPSTIDRTLSTISQKIGAKNRVHLAVVYAAKQLEQTKKQDKRIEKIQKQILTYMAQGEPVEEIATKLGLTKSEVDSDIVLIKRIYEDPDASHTNIVLKAIRTKDIELLPEINRIAFDNLTPLERKTLIVLVGNDGKNSSYTNMGRLFKISPRTAGSRVSKINKKVGTKNQAHLAAMYKSYLMLYG